MHLHCHQHQHRPAADTPQPRLCFVASRGMLDAMALQASAERSCWRLPSVPPCREGTFACAACRQAPTSPAQRLALQTAAQAHRCLLQRQHCARSRPERAPQARGRPPRPVLGCTQSANARKRVDLMHRPGPWYARNKLDSAAPTLVPSAPGHRASISARLQGKHTHRGKLSEQPHAGSDVAHLSIL